MLITNIKPYYFSSTAVQRNNTVRKADVQNNKTGCLTIPPLYSYTLIPFTGGKSMNLADTKRQLDMHGKYPEHIREEIEKVLAAGNPENKTLIDIHLEQYSLLDECETLEEAKELYPEFKDVISDKDIEYREDTFFDRVKKGKVKAFAADKDTALQLLQLYWGKGFSLKTLETEYAGQNILGVMRRLNIPRADSVYAQYLKLSDKDYNKRYADYMSGKLKGITHAGRKGIPLSGEHKEKISDSILEYFEKNPFDDARREKISDGLKAFYAEHPMTDEQKHAISEGMIEYCAEHPEKMAERSALRKKFYEEHPEENEKFAQIVLRAWSYPEAEPIRKAMSDFMGRKDIISSDEILKLISEGGEKNFKGFWEINEWAEAPFSKCMKKSWARQKELSEMGLIYEPLYSISILPKLFTLQHPDLQKKALYNIADPREINYWKENSSGEVKKSALEEIILELPPVQLVRCIYSIMKGVSETSKTGSQYEQYGREYFTHIENQRFKDSSFFREYLYICRRALENGDYDFMQKLTRKINDTYSKICKMKLDKIREKSQKLIASNCNLLLLRQ